ncbi:MAG: nuclear transport factor 2 (NTF2) superfamily protein [Lysobacterales bacterium]|jgi:nuclear transport factor 2 (NTF2) superfamily protein
MNIKEITMSKIIKPPFTQETARAKVQVAEDAWNSRDPDRVALAYSEDSNWRNRDQFFTGRDAIREFLSDKWEKELHYRLMKELWAWTDNRISVRFIYEWQDSASGQWFRTHGNEHWEFNQDGLMQRRDMSANDVPIRCEDRQLSTSTETNTK